MAAASGAARGSGAYDGDSGGGSGAGDDERWGVRRAADQRQRWRGGGRSGPGRRARAAAGRHQRIGASNTARWVGVGESTVIATAGGGCSVRAVDPSSVEPTTRRARFGRFRFIFIFC